MMNQFPEEPKLKKYYNTYKITKMYDSKLPIKIFMGSTLKFKDQIKTRDAEFFKNRKTFVNKLVEFSSFTDEMGLSQYYDTLSDPRGLSQKCSPSLQYFCERRLYPHIEI